MVTLLWCAHAHIFCEDIVSVYTMFGEEWFIICCVKKNKTWSWYRHTDISPQIWRTHHNSVSPAGKCFWAWDSPLFVCTNGWLLILLHYADFCMLHTNNDILCPRIFSSMKNWMIAYILYLETDVGTISMVFFHTTWNNEPFFTKLGTHNDYTFTKNMRTSASQQCYHNMPMK